MTDPPEVHLDLAGPLDAPLLDNLLQLYLHDLSEVFPIELNAEGRVDYDKLSIYRSEPERRFAYLIRNETRVIGFILAQRGSPVTDDPEVFDIAEFFILRRYRRTGAGKRAAFLLWERHPGRWIVRVSEGNKGALPFWTTVIAEYSGGRATEATYPDEPHGWRVFSFDSSPL